MGMHRLVYLVYELDPVAYLVVYPARQHTFAPVDSVGYVNDAPPHRIVGPLKFYGRSP